MIWTLSVFYGIDFGLAYIDPGSGAMLLQLILAGAIGAGVVFRRFFYRLFAGIVNLFRGKKS